MFGYKAQGLPAQEVYTFFEAHSDAADKFNQHSDNLCGSLR